MLCKKVYFWNIFRTLFLPFPLQPLIMHVLSVRLYKHVWFYSKFYWNDISMQGKSIFFFKKGQQWVKIYVLLFKFMTSL